MSRFAAILAGAVFALSGCGGSSGTTANSSPTPTPTPTTAAGRVIGISGMAFSPLQLQVTPGETVTVQNHDPMEHTVTSEATSGAFVPGAVGGVSFDVTVPPNASATFTIPANAAVGTKLPYYCRIHTSTMATPNGEIDVVATAASTPTDGGTAPPPPPPTIPGY
ncbi:cupredoxin domain-containing protein [Anaeromyxobacter paludicola]|uniref:Blue (Type 1) copper domain protein n=1 Tax=Anaeromyxobacter paludicola TaxID=2918171 RepID=A0ABN6N257_9BACT|nr:hypothetical protein [Anaeromyxobacter paludicola]BDG07299.1 hypothetical protein AMPC_04120 [Anaeromyxobacter paludicola]